VKTVDAIAENNYEVKEQDTIQVTTLKPAPKLTRLNTKINFNKKPEEVRNFIRGLNPEPGAHAELNLPANYLSFMVKIYEVDAEEKEHNEPTGNILTDHKSFLKIYVKGGLVSLKDIKVSGRSKMTIRDFLNGFKMEGKWKFNAS
jgi:methionyl-tRNA formyltransferase